MKSITRCVTALVIFIFALALNAGAQAVRVTSYDIEYIESTPRSGFACWSHSYLGAITNTGPTASGAGYCNLDGNQIANYIGGSGTLNANVISAITNDNHVFTIGLADDGNPIFPEITLHLDGTFVINKISMFGGDAVGYAQPGALTSATVEIGGVAVDLPTIPFGSQNALGIYPDGALFLAATPLEGSPTNQIVLKNFGASFFGSPYDQFSLTEITVDGSPPPVNSYAVTDLGTLCCFHTEATGINAGGQATGSSVNAGGLTHAFRTAPNATINPATDDLSTLGGNSSQATGINNAGQVVGVSFTADGALHAFRTAANAAIRPATDDLGTLGGDTSWAYGINASGQAVGYSVDVGGQTRAFRTTANAAINPATDDLGSLVSSPSQAVAYAINATGQVVGASYAGQGTHAFRTAPNSAINPGTDDLGTLGGPQSYGLGINASGQVVGYSDVSSELWHAFRTAPNAVISPATDDLGTLGAYSIAFGINASGQVVGTSQIASGESHAFVYSGVMRDLNDFILVGSGWILEEADGINDVGQIVGVGLHNGETRAFRATPVVPFSAFNASAETEHGGFELDGRFALGTGSNGINLLTKVVTLQFGPYAVTIPTGRFARSHGGAYIFKGNIAGTVLVIRITQVTTNSYAFNAEGSGANLGAANSILVGLVIGDDGGSTPVKAER